MNHFDIFKEEDDRKDYFLDIKYLLDQRIYHYGQHFLGNNDAFYDYSLKRILRKKFKLYKELLVSYGVKERKTKCISGGYFNLGKYIQELDIEVLPMPWKSRIGEWDSFKKLFQNYFFFEEASYSQLTTNEMFELWKTSFNILLDLFLRLEAKFLIVPNDVSLFERLSIKAFENLDKPSFLFNHGLPGRYNMIDDNETNYLVVWGSSVKQHYVKAGIKEEKILISGNPRYGNYKLSNISISGDMSRVLVLTKSMNGAQNATQVTISDRGNMIYYLNSVMKVLKKIGVHKAFFRPHPSENHSWYYKYIDNEFYKIDPNVDIIHSFKTASCIIGPTSTCIVDALFAGKQYFVYEPSEGVLDCLGNPLVPPFDKSDDRVPVAFNPEELNENLVLKKCINKYVLGDYVSEKFDISFLKKIN